MAISVVMPALEMAQETGKLLSWRKKEGERTVKGEPLLEIETDKATVEVEATAEGILAGISSKEGDVVAVGTVIAWILQPGEKLPVEASRATDSTPSTRASAATTQVGPSESQRNKSVAAAAGAGTRESAKLSPKARRLAKEHGVDVSQIRGTGPDGSITTEDILGAKDGPRASSITASPTSAEMKPPQGLSTIGRIMAERTTRSWTTVPQFSVVRDADGGALIEYQKKNKTAAIPVSVTDCLVGLVARTLERHPAQNSSWSDDSIRTNSEINISIAIAVTGGVIAPVIHNANAATLL